MGLHFSEMLNGSFFLLFLILETSEYLTLKAPITDAADDIFAMYSLLVDISLDISCETSAGRRFT